jgi:hypothetical protein
MDKSKLKKDFFEFVKHLEEMANIHDEHCHVVKHKKTGDSGTKNNGKGNDAGIRSSGHNAGGSSHGGARNKASDRDRTMSGHGRSPESTGTGKQSAREPPPCLNAKKCAGERHYLSDFPHTEKDEDIVPLSEYKKKRGMPTRRRRTLRLWATMERRRKPEVARPRISRQRISESMSQYWQTQTLTTPLYRAVLWRTQGRVASLPRSKCCRSPSC